MNRKNDNGSTVWKVLGGIIVGALVGVGAGIIGSEVNKNNREQDILDLRKRSKVQLHAQRNSQQPPQQGQQPQQEIYTQIESFYCPITQEIMQQPMILSGCSHSFERIVIVEWVEKHGDCPLCKAPASLKDMKPNYSLKNAISELRAKTAGN